MSDNIESAIIAAGATVGPRITPAAVEANIIGEHYFTAADGYAGALSASAEAMDELPQDADGNPIMDVPGALDLLTFCVLELKNGFTVTGESACASPENFNAEIGQRIARQNAVAKIWPLMGYELRTQIAEQADPNGRLI